MDDHTRLLLSAFKSNLSRDTRDRIRSLRVFGSYARGEAEPDSDLDILALVDRWTPELQQAIADAAYRAMWDDDFKVILSPKVFTEEEFLTRLQQGYSFYRSVAKEAIAL
ncbi:MAG: hypothetical protein AUJ92_01285 [Armatimonadetes bacterium CG2_30_59_28]|nr:hypothetical protein [Armatimonadota bacterium]OIO98468.1 MAG: hypothetical protein AUJ92_01285 [Armatimonadetes bacterium CG2_30_59_28]PIU64392.1 MAG: hypothetical protein COS85_12670 [Armatimonadetes bacterium CG07_land_8_20_14_0_80_59_28]PIY43729.1 MAG: hypothetical protein COZ05_10205 [Armatimonadetes bacterium CG_4_10_14_3_um_filter_59_10]PJB69243.1 MAG: hypothetical protein CO095_10185 [Armatimonadetes bacterium CG_4_9_14_3_um_filter_58_7]